MESEIKRGLYRHYRGKLYEVIGTARHSETLEKLVVYHALYNSKKFGKNVLWARPMNMFSENVRIDGRKVPRFKYLGRREIK